MAELDEAIEAAALAISVYDWHNGLSSNPEIGKPQRAEAEVAVKAAAEVIVAATRRQVAEETRARRCCGPDDPECCCCHELDQAAAAIARGRGETQPPPTH